MCGSENRLFKAEIEGTVLHVCQNCAKYGKVVGRVESRADNITRTRTFTKRPLISDKELSEVLVEDYSQIIKKKRESLGLKQEDFAKKINEKVSVIHKIETGHFEPSIKLARKIERFLKVKIIEQHAGAGATPSLSKSGSFTLGDFIKLKD